MTLLADLAYTPPPAPTPFDPTTLLLKLLGMTAVVLALCGLVLWLGRRKPTPAAAANGRLVLAGSLPLDRRSAIHLLRADGRTVAVTADAGGLRSIVVLSDAPADHPA
jgi:hypothetical protein